MSAVRGIFGIEIYAQAETPIKRSARWSSPGIFLSMLSCRGCCSAGSYAACAVGITIAFGMLDIVNIAHPAFIVLGAFVAYYLNTTFGIDPLLSATLSAPLPMSAAVRSIAVTITPSNGAARNRCEGSSSSSAFSSSSRSACSSIFGVDYRFVEAPYIGPTCSAVVSVRFAYWFRSLSGSPWWPSIYASFSRTFIGRAIVAVSQDPGALRLVGANPYEIKEIAFGVSIATAIVAGALLIIIQPVEPSVGARVSSAASSPSACLAA